MIRKTSLFLILAGLSPLARPIEKIRKDALTVGIQPGTPPFGLNENAAEKGLEYDIIAAIAKRMGMSFRIVRLATPKDGEDLLAADKIDVVISRVKPSASLRERFLLSNPYYKTGLGVLALKSNQSILTISDLNGKPVALTPESGAEALVNSFAPKAKIEMLRSIPDALALLEKGDVEAVIHDAPLLMAEQSRNQGLKLLDFSFTEDNYVMLFHRKSAPLANAVNAEITRLRTTSTSAPDPLTMLCARYRIPSTLKTICDGCNAPPPARVLADKPVQPALPAPQSTPRSQAKARGDQELLDSLLRQLHEMEATILELKKNAVGR